MGDSAGPITGTVTAAIPNSDGSKLFYSVNNGRVFEAASNNGWRNLWTGISGVSNNALAVITVGGVKYIYTVSGGNVYEAHSANGWRNLWTGISGVSDNAIAALNDGIHIKNAGLFDISNNGIFAVNDGINIASSEGEPVWAAADGEVVYVGNELQGYGNMVLIRHDGNRSTTYAHLNRATVDKYDRVKQGDIIGYVGSTGNVKQPQLHFAVREGKNPVDPRKYLARSLASN
jgi:murein DD-endopeptidase MepM/ murein hydrolase activator NlpD